MAKFCGKCGTPLPENASFCPKCGNNCTSSPAVPKAETPDTLTFESQEPILEQDFQSAPPPKKKKKGLITILGILLAVLLIGGAVLAYFLFPHILPR